MLLKYSLKPENTSEKQHHEFYDKINIYKKLVSKKCIQMFHKEIRSLRSRSECTQTAESMSLLVCLPTPLTLACGGSPIILLLVHQPNGSVHKSRGDSVVRM